MNENETPIFGVDNLYVGMSEDGAWLLLKVRWLTGDHEALFFPSATALWLLKNMRAGNAPTGLMPRSPQPDITDDDWDGRGNRRVVTGVRCDQGTNGLLMHLTFGDERAMRVAMANPHLSLFQHYLTQYEPHLVDLEGSHGGSA